MKKLFVTLFVTAGLCSFNSAFSQTTLVGTWENITQKGKSDGKPVTEFWRFSADTMFWMQGPEKMPQYDAKKIKNTLKMHYTYANDTIYGGSFVKLRVSELTANKLVIQAKMGEEIKVVNFKRAAKE